MIGTAIKVNDGIGRQPRELTEEEYVWLLECLPPMFQRSNSFVNGEPVTTLKNGRTNLYSCCFEFTVQGQQRFFLITATKKEYMSIEYEQSYGQFLDYLATLPPLSAIKFDWRSTYTSSLCYTHDPISLRDRANHFYNLAFDESSSSVNIEINTVERDIAIDATQNAINLITNHSEEFSNVALQLGNDCLTQVITPDQAVTQFLELMKIALTLINTQFKELRVNVNAFLFSIDFITYYWDSDFIPQDVLSLLTPEKLAAKLFNHPSYIKMHETWLTFQYN